MLLKTKAIVLSSVKYSDNNAIVHTYTETHGRMSYAINGVRSKKACLRLSMIQPLSILEIETDYNAKKDLQRIRESRLFYAFSDIPYNPSKNALAIFIAELLSRSLKEPQTDPELYQFLHHSICTLDGLQQGLRNFHLSFLVQFSYYMGFAPQNSDYAAGRFFDLNNGSFVASTQSFGQYLNSFESSLFASLCDINYTNMVQYFFSKDEKKKLLSHLLDYYKLHLPNFTKLKSLEIMYELFK